MPVDNSVSEVRLTRSLTMNIYENDKVNSTIGALICISGEFLGAIFRINADRKILFGRDYRVVDFCFHDETISKEHCWIEYDADYERYLLCDTSRNGVFVNGDKRVEKGATIFLKKGDEIRLGKTENIFKMG